MDGRLSALRSLSAASAAAMPTASAKSIVAEWLRGKIRSATPSATNADVVGPTDFDLSVAVAVALCLSFDIYLLVKIICQIYRNRNHRILCAQEEEEDGEVKEIMTTASPIKIVEEEPAAPTEKALQSYARRTPTEDATLLSFARKFPAPKTPERSPRSYVYSTVRSDS